MTDYSLNTIFHDTNISLKCHIKYSTYIYLVQSKLFNDSIHKTVVLKPVEVAIIQTPEFFRLKNIKQLGRSIFNLVSIYECPSSLSAGITHKILLSMLLLFALTE